MTQQFKFFVGYTWSTTSVVVAAETRRLRAIWTPEMVQDLNLYGIDAEAELMRLVTEEIDGQIMRNLLDMGGNRA